MDPEIDPTAYLTDDLREKASACGVLMIVMSKRYLKSSWCDDELEWFKEQVEGRAGRGGRVFVIHAQKTDESLWPDFLRDERGHAMMGFSFYDPESGIPLGLSTAGAQRRLFQGIGAACRFGSPSACANCANAPPKAHGENAAPRRRGATPTASGASISMRRPDSESARAEIGRALEGRRHRTADAQSGARERSCGLGSAKPSERIGLAKRCEALRFAARRRRRSLRRRSSRHWRRRAQTHVRCARRAVALRGARQDRRTACRSTSRRSASSASTSTGPTGAASSARGSTRRAARRREPRRDRRSVHHGHPARAALSRPATVRRQRMGDLLRPGADDRRRDRPSRRKPAGADPRRLGLWQVVAGACRRAAEARAPI